MRKNSTCSWQRKSASAHKMPYRYFEVAAENWFVICAQGLSVTSVSLLAIQNAGDLNLTFAVGLLQVGLDISRHEIRYVRRPYHNQLQYLLNMKSTGIASLSSQSPSSFNLHWSDASIKVWVVAVIISLDLWLASSISLKYRCAHVSLRQSSRLCAWMFTSWDWISSMTSI